MMTIGAHLLMMIGAVLPVRTVTTGRVTHSRNRKLLFIARAVKLVDGRMMDGIMMDTTRQIWTMLGHRLFN